MTRSFHPLFFVLIICLTMSSCQVREDAGAADYYIVNNSSTDLQIVYVTVPQLGSMTDSATLVSQNATVLLLNDAIFGVNPRPTDSFVAIRAYSMDAGDSLVYEQEHIDNDLWVITDQNLGKSGYGLTKYELRIDDAALTLN